MDLPWWHSVAKSVKVLCYILYNCTSIKKELKKKGFIILNVIDNIKWKLGVLQFHSAYTRAAPGLHYKIIPACNTWHTSIVSGVIKQLETLQFRVWFSTHKGPIFATIFRYMTLLTKGQKSESMGME
jgi:hypothetical protein